MKINFHRASAAGFSLPLVAVFVTLSFVVIAGLTSYVSSGGQAVERYRVNDGTVAAAEAAIEKITTRMLRDFRAEGPDYVATQLGAYQGAVPTAGEDPEWANYVFTDPAGTPDQAYVVIGAAWHTSALLWKYPGFTATNAIYDIVVNARDARPGPQPVRAVHSRVQLAAVPIFQYAFFYDFDLSFNVWHDFDVTGPVHCNRNMYCDPEGAGVDLRLQGPVTARGEIRHLRHPYEGGGSTTGTTTYSGARDSHAFSVRLSLATNVSNRALIEIPPIAESPTSLLGQERFYNKADLVILVDPGSVDVRDRDATVTIPYWTNFVSTNITFTDRREPSGQDSVIATQLDVAQFIADYANLTTSLGVPPRIVYLADRRTNIAGTFPAVRVVNGQFLPDGGLTIATWNPLYVKGHYNAPSPGTADTSDTEPAALVADAITILSGSWNDANSGAALSSRLASDTTVNAGVLTGINPAISGDYDGGLINCFRLLEHWDGRTLRFNGSFVALFESAISTTPWWGHGTVYYRPSWRIFFHDQNFRDMAKLPPGTPAFHVFVRADWQYLTAGAIP